MFNNLFNHCDQMVSNWMNGSLTNDPFLSTQKNNRGLLKSDYIDLMPEPFWGNPNDSNKVAVMLNLNPGFGNQDKKYIGKQAVSRVLPNFQNSYSTFAQTSPYFTNHSFHPCATDWWNKRYDWLKSLFGNASFPFVLELCPWHSHNWSEARIDIFTPQQKQYIETYVIDPAWKAAQRSVSHLIISIGKKYVDIYQNLGFTLEKEWGPGQHSSIKSPWPQSNKTKKDKNVHFLYFSKCIEGEQKIKVLSIWLWGSNKTPCADFLNVEKDIIAWIATH